MTRREQRFAPIARIVSCCLASSVYSHEQTQAFLTILHAEQQRLPFPIKLVRAAVSDSSSSSSTASSAPVLPYVPPSAFGLDPAFDGSPHSASISRVFSLMSVMPLMYRIRTYLCNHYSPYSPFANSSRFPSLAVPDDPRWPKQVLFDDVEVLTEWTSAFKGYGTMSPFCSPLICGAIFVQACRKDFVGLAKNLSLLQESARIWPMARRSFEFMSKMLSGPVLLSLGTAPFSTMDSSDEESTSGSMQEESLVFLPDESL